MVVLVMGNLFNVVCLEFLKIALPIQFCLTIKFKVKGEDITSKFKVWWKAFVMVPTNSKYIKSTIEVMRQSQSPLRFESSRHHQY